MKKIIKYIPILLLIFFLCLLYIYQNGYYEKYLRKKIDMTNYNIEKFEQDIKDGKDVTIDDYIEEEKDYSSKLSNLSLKLSYRIENIVDKSIKYFFKKLSSYLE